MIFKDLRLIMTMRILAIGDIHGCTIAFDSLIAAINLQPSGRIWQANQKGNIRQAWLDEFLPD